MSQKHAQNLIGILLVLSLTWMMIPGCGSMKGEEETNLPPTVKFATTPVSEDTFSYAPIIYWTGNDPDGFVEYYSYADITDEAALPDRSSDSAYAATADRPISFYSQIPEDAWVDTIATQARIFLLTEEGEYTDHVFYVRCFDNEGLENSTPTYRIYSRSNRAPNIPRIGLTGTSDDDMAEHVYVADTLFCGDKVTNTWPGIQISWRDSDPDDQALYTIPLQYQPILVKAPGDTIFVSDWKDETEIVLVNLETGFYTLYIWARDDAFQKSVAPARIEFNVIRPTFEHNILLVVEAPSNAQNFYFPELDSLVNDEGTGFYNRLLEDIAPDIYNADLQFNEEDVRFYKITLDNPDMAANMVPKALIHQYKLVIFTHDQLFHQIASSADPYKTQRNRVLIDYLRVGGRLWYQGRALNYRVLPSPPDTVYNGGDVYTKLLEDFFDVVSGNGQILIEGISNESWVNLQALAEFIGTDPELQEFPRMKFDSTRVEENWVMLPGGIPGGYVDSLQWGESGVERITRGNYAISTQKFVSYTSTYTGVVYNEDSDVVSEVELPGQTPLFYPPTPFRCFIQTFNNNVYNDDSLSVINRSLYNLHVAYLADNPEVSEEDSPYRNWEGDIISVNDDYIYVGYVRGEPWAQEDTLEVSYRFNPESNFAGAPVEIIRESVQSSIPPEIRFRTALSTFSYYYMEPEAVREAWTELLNWFLDPQMTDYAR